MGLITFSGGINSALRVQRWGTTLWHVFQRDQFFYHFTSGDGQNIVHEKLDFTKKAGFQMTEGLIMPFVGDGVINDEILEDSEEAPDFFNMTWTISQLRNAGRYAGEETQQMTETDLPTEIRNGLGDWMKNKKDIAVFDQLAGSPTKIYYVNDRAGTSTIVAGDLCTLQQFVRAKTYATSTAYPKIPPIKVAKVGEKTIYRYVGLMHDHVAYDLAMNDPVYQQTVRDAGVRGVDNPMFSGALIDYMGTLLHAHDNCPTFATWGSGANVAGAESYLLGRQAVIVGIGGYKIRDKNGYLRYIEKRFDYENQFGVAVGIIKGEARAVYNSKDFSVVAIRSSRTNIS